MPEFSVERLETRPSVSLFASAKVEAMALSSDEEVMTARALFAVSIILSFVAWGIVAGRYL
ncbi:MAG TPA: hypothetical protein VFD58_04170 [Blastocatellia bacterium]|nr:hypothetical protein [Blastocatellia bacterium]